MNANRTRGLGLAVLAIALAGAAPAMAHTTPPEHGCSAPQRPVDDQNDRDWQEFLRAVDGFRACISNYAAANHTAADRHREHANAAIVEWNEFVRTRLNVPEDFPWPPPAGTP